MANSRERLKQKEGEKAFKKRRKMEQRETGEKKSNIKKGGKEGGGSDKGRK
jgi:Spy/CpxP family protein refolding chaperone